ncbi:MAG: SIMPL domain-containing protein [Polyangiaceae bacterium]|nr:SIMPL domain-containing protein [Polyangiaceae bacterium]
MKRSLVMLATCFVLAAAGGCSIQGVGPASPSAPADAGIVVSGEGEARAKPDIAILRLGVEAHRPTMEEARTAAASAQARILQAAKAAGVAAADVQTEQLSMAPVYDYGEKGRTLRGYAATNIVRITMRDISKSGALVDATVAAGDNDARIDSISFEMSDTAAVRAEARRAAVEDAKKKAEQLAAELGVELGDVLAIEETAVSAPGPIMMRAEFTKDAATPIQPGSVETHVAVRVRWAIDAG